MYDRCPICLAEATVISLTGIRCHYCPRVSRNVWWKRSIFVVDIRRGTEVSTDEVVTRILGKRR